MVETGYTIERMLLEDLIPHPENPYVHPETQLAALRASYATFGAVQFPIWNRRTGRMVDGHARVKMLTESGHQSVEVLVVDWDEETEKKALLTINHSSRMAGIDDEAFLSLLAQFSEDDPLLSLMYDEASVKRLLEETKVELPAPLPKARAKDDREGGGDAFVEGLAALPPTRTNAGEVWALGRHRLIVGDCALTSTLRALKLPLVDLLLTDPPYNIEAQSGGTELGSRAIWKDLRAADLDGFDPIPFLDTVEVYLNTACNFETFCDVSLLSLYLDWGRARGFTTDVCFWKKSNPIPLGSQRWPDVEYIVCLRRHGAFNEDAPHRRSKSHPYGREKGEHPTIKPLGLVVGEMELLSKEGAVVFDPFVGSGTTIIAGERLNRIVYACEKNPRFADLCLARWEAETGARVFLVEETT